MSPRRIGSITSLVVGTGLVLVGALGAAGDAGAQGDLIEPFDVTIGYDHVNPPPPGGLSSADWCFSFADPALAGSRLTGIADGPSGPAEGTGVIGDDGTAKLRLPISQGGTFTLTELSVDETGQLIVLDDVPTNDVVFDPEFIDCLDTLAVPPPVVETTAPTTTAAPETTIPATSAADSATPETSASASTAAPATAPVESIAPPLDPAPTDGGGSSAGWWILFGGGLAIVLGGFGVLFGPKLAGAKRRDPCAELDALRKRIAEVNEKIDERKFPKGKEPDPEFWEGVARAKRNAPFLPSTGSPELRRRYGEHPTHEERALDVMLNNAWGMGEMKQEERRLAEECAQQRAEERAAEQAVRDFADEAVAATAYAAKLATMSDDDKKKTLRYNERHEVENYELILRNRHKRLEQLETQLEQDYGKEIPRSAFGYDELQQLKKDIAETDEKRTNLLNSRIPKD